MQWSAILQAVQAVSVLLAIWVALGTVRGRRAQEVADLTEMKVDIKYIKQAVSEMDGLQQRVALVEQSAKSAHRRLDAYAESTRAS